MAQLTYKKMTQQINAIDDYIKLIREILKDYNDDKDKVCKFGDIIDALLCYRNYLKYDKVYTPNDDSAAQQRATADWEIIDRDANGQRCYQCPECGVAEWRYDAADFCPHCGADMRRSDVQ